MIEQIRQISMQLPEVVEMPHFEKTSFRVAGKIFATVDVDHYLLNVKLSLIDQDVFRTISAKIYPIPNKWGKQGWTRIELESLNSEMLKDILHCAYKVVAPKRLSDLVDEE